MIRNHQYEYADLVYFEDKNNLDPDYAEPTFMSDSDITEELLQTLPSNVGVSGKIRKHCQVVFMNR